MPPAAGTHKEAGRIKRTMTMKSSKQKIKRFRDPLSPKPILDRAALAKALKSNCVSLKNNQLDSFYQLLHRSGYPPLREFVADLRGGEQGSVAARDNGGGDDDGGSVSVAESIGGVSNNFRNKNAVSSRPGRRPQLPKSFLSYLANNIDEYATLTSKVQMHKTSADGTTTKLAVELQDKHVVESVLMRHEGRVTICVSSQVGCAMGCTFCATGTMGMRGNLSEGEILEQLVHGTRILARSAASDEGKENDDDGEIMESTGSPEDERLKKRRGRNKRPDLIRNVVFMGMGEPLNNYSNVLAACRALIDRRLWNLSHNRVTVSTVGVPARMRDLTRDLPEVNLALSLHAPDQETRERIVPAAKGAPVESLIEALDEHMMALAKRKLLGNQNPQQGSDRDGNLAVGAAEFNVEERRSASKKKRAMIEYVMLEGDTSTIEAAHKLGKLCEGRHLVVNLIPYNQTDVRDKLICPIEERMQDFRRIVSSYGSFCSIRRTMGADIAGACGQLVVEREKGQSSVGDIEDGPFCKDEVGKRPVALLSRRDGKNKHDDERHGEHPKSEAMEVDPWVRRLTVATAVAASCFVVSGTLLLLQKRKR